jgi:anti-sigma factor RsiW
VADLSDEILMAYADGVLDAADRADVEKSIREHPEYEQKVEKFRATLKPVHQAFEGALDKNRLATLTARIRGKARPTASTGRSGPEIVALPRAQLRTSSVSANPSWPTTLAASFALLVGGALGWLMHGSPGREPASLPDLVTFGDGSLQAGGTLAALLETASSGAAVQARDAHGRTWQLRATLSFYSVGDLPCRRYELTNDATGRFAGYACRSVDARWLVQAHARLDNKVRDQPGFAPASGSDQGALDAAMRAVMDGEVLQSSEESQLIASHWATKRK